MHMRRLLISIFLSVILLLAPLTDRAQQSPAAPKPQSTPPAQPAAPGQQRPQQSGQTIVVPVNLVDVLFTVLDRRNKLVPALDKTDFKIFDDKLPQEIRYFSKQSDLPLRIGVLLDTSNSIRDRIKFEQDASINFLFTVLRRNKDEAFAMTFDDEPQIIQPFTGDAGALRDQITKTRAGGGTAIYDAIYEACVKELSHPPRPPGDQPDVVRRVMVLISDGEDNLSMHTRARAAAILPAPTPTCRQHQTLPAEPLNNVFLKMRYAWRESQANAEFLARNIVQQHGVRFRVSALDP